VVDGLNRLSLSRISDTATWRKILTQVDKNCRTATRFVTFTSVAAASPYASLMNSRFMPKGIAISIESRAPKTPFSKKIQISCLSSLVRDGTGRTSRISTQDVGHGTPSEKFASRPVNRE
jgi:hypothetical protein